MGKKLLEVKLPADVVVRIGRSSLALVEPAWVRTNEVDLQQLKEELLDGVNTRELECREVLK